MRTLIFYFSIFILAGFSFAQYSGEYPLSTADASFVGEHAGDQAGYHASIIGDVNNDGFDDILISAPNYDENPEDADPLNIIKENGKVYLFFGKAEGWENSINLVNADASFMGDERGNEASHDVYGVGDVNGDGIDDFAIGVKFINQTGLRAGKVYIFFGKASGWPVLTHLSSADASYLGEGETGEAAHVYPAGNINGDAYDDIIIGAGFFDTPATDAGKCYVILGKPTDQWAKDVSLADADASYIGEQEGDWAAHRVAGVGDVNGDGLDDFIVGANGRDIDNFQNRGITYLILGKTEGWTPNVSLSEADASFIGYPQKNLNSGWTISPAGDVNSDNLADFLIGARGKSRAFLILGQTAPFGKDVLVDEISATVFKGETDNDYMASDLRAAGDINLDGYDDFIIGAPENDAASNNAGRAYLVYGRESWPDNFPIADADAIFTGENENDQAGWTVASGGDVDNNGTNDLLIAAPKYDVDTNQDVGKVYLYLTQPLELKLTSPNGGETWYLDQPKRISWIIDPDIANVSVELSYDAGATWTTLAADTPNDGGFEWTVEGPLSESCLVRITDVANPENTDSSDAPFAISDAIEFSLTSPNGGEVWEAAKQHSVTWHSVGASGKVSIKLSRDAGNTWEELAASTEDDGEFEWTVTGPASASCQVIVSDVDGIPADTSETVFTINVTPEIILKGPNGGQTWNVGENNRITWSSVFLGDSVKIEISRDGGATWDSLTNNIANSGVYVWEVTGPGSENCLIKVIDTESGQADSSDNIFTILDPTSVVDTKSESVPDKFELLQNYPNPFNPTTRISFNIPTATRVRLDIYNIRGELINRLVDKQQSPGVYEIVWDGKNMSGQQMSSGIYFYKLYAGTFQQVRQMTLLK